MYRLGSKLNRTVSNSCGTPIIRVAQITRDMCTARFFLKKNLKRAIHWKPKKEVDYFWKHQTSNSRLRQTRTQYLTIHSIPFRKNDLLRITYFRIPGVPGTVTVDRLGGDGFWKGDYGWGVRVRRPFGARGMSSVRYGTRLGDLKENWFLLFSN